MSRRRGRGEGSIYRRGDGRWCAILDLGWSGGQRRRRFLYGKTRAETAQRLHDALRAQRDGLPVTGERQTVAAFLSSWLDAVRARVRPATHERYESYIRLHVAPHIGHLPLARLTPAQLQGLYADRLAAGLSPMSVRHLHAVLHTALDQAERWAVVARNVADLVDAPRAPRHEMTALSPEQVRVLLDAATGERHEALYTVAVTTGMRLGELLALRWRDVDLDAGTAQVRASLVAERGGGFTFAEPKSARSRRQVMLTQAALAALRQHRVRQAEERLHAGPAWDDLDLVFANEVGRPLSRANLVGRSFLPLLRRAGLPRIRFHDLRHTAATLLLGRGVHPRIAADMLGHATVAVTLDTYSHVTPTMQREAVAALDSLFGAR